MNGADLRALAERVAAMPAVARLSPGPWGTVAVHLPGEQIPGLRVDGDRLAAVHIVLEAGATVAEAAVEVAAAVALFADPAQVELHVDDVAVPGDPSADDSSGDGVVADGVVADGGAVAGRPAVDDRPVDPAVERLAADAPLFRAGVGR